MCHVSTGYSKKTEYCMIFPGVHSHPYCLKSILYQCRTAEASSRVLNGHPGYISNPICFHRAIHLAFCISAINTSQPVIIIVAAKLPPQRTTVTHVLSSATNSKIPSPCESNFHFSPNTVVGNLEAPNWSSRSALVHSRTRSPFAKAFTEC